MTLPELIEALEKATGPSRELDAQIAAVVEPYRFDAPGFTPERPIPEFDLDKSEGAIRFRKGGIMDLRFFPPVTGSADEALALAERLIPGAWYHLAKGKTRVEEPLYGAALMFGDEPIGLGEHDASQAIAICIASLKALQARGDA